MWPTENHDGEVDIHAERAAVCCLLASYGTLDLAKLKPFQRLNFKEIYVPPLSRSDWGEKSRKQSLLVAIAEDSKAVSMYVAFRGNSNLSQLSDIFSTTCQPPEFEIFDESTSPSGADKASYHETFCQQVSEMVPRKKELLELCRSLMLKWIENHSMDDTASDCSQKFSQLRRRLIFCGHSLGGVLSHLATLHTLSIFGIPGDDVNDKEQLAGPISITFGAPLFTDNIAANLLDKKFPHRFQSFHHEKDPVPFILGGASTSQEAQEHLQEITVKHGAKVREASKFLAYNMSGNCKGVRKDGCKTKHEQPQDGKETQVKKHSSQADKEHPEFKSNNYQSQDDGGRRVIGVGEEMHRCTHDQNHGRCKEKVPDEEGQSQGITQGIKNVVVRFFPLFNRKNHYDTKKGKSGVTGNVADNEEQLAESISTTYGAPQSTFTSAANPLHRFPDQKNPTSISAGDFTEYQTQKHLQEGSHDTQGDCKKEAPLGKRQMSQVDKEPAILSTDVQSQNQDVKRLSGEGEEVHETNQYHGTGKEMGPDEGQSQSSRPEAKKAQDKGSKTIHVKNVGTEVKIENQNHTGSAADNEEQLAESISTTYGAPQSTFTGAANPLHRFPDQKNPTSISAGDFTEYQTRKHLQEGSHDLKGSSKTKHPQVLGEGEEVHERNQYRGKGKEIVPYEEGQSQSSKPFAKVKKAIKKVKHVKKSLGTEIKIAKQKLADDGHFFSPVGVQKQIQYRKRTSDTPFGYQKRGLRRKRTRTCVTYRVTCDKHRLLQCNFSLKMRHMQCHKMESYVNSLVSLRSANTSVPNQPCEVTIREFLRPRLDDAKMILLKGDTPDTVKGARIVATGSDLSLVAEGECQVSAFSSIWRLVTAEPRRIIFETMPPAGSENVHISNHQSQVIELAKVEHAEKATSISVRTIFSGDSEAFVPVFFRDLAADSAVIDGLKHSVGKVLVLLETDDYKEGEASAAGDILSRLRQAARLTCLDQSLRMITERTSSTVHEKRMKIDEEFIAPLSYELCYKPITLDFHDQGAEDIEKAASHHLVKFFTCDGDVSEVSTDPFIESLDLSAMGFRKPSAGQVLIELNSYDKILSCLHALVGDDKHRGMSAEGAQECTDRIKDYEKALWEVMKSSYEGAERRLKERCSSHSLSDTSCKQLSNRLALLYALSSASDAAKKQTLLALIGPENVGKSTLAGVLGCKSTESPGYLIHTADVKSYRLAPDLLTVDFPGTEGSATRSSLSQVWESFSKLPDRCIVVTAFTGDVTQASQTWPLTAAQKLCPHVMLVVNRVDCVLKGPPKAKIWKEFTRETMESLRKEFLKENHKAGVDLELIFCCLEEESLFEEEIEQLRKLGILFRDDVRTKILHWVRSNRDNYKGQVEPVPAA